MKVPLKINLSALLQQAAPQVFGSDERDTLYAFLDRQTDPERPEDGPTPVIVTIDFSLVLIKPDEPGG
jgi:hypothetical protein